MAGAIMFAQHYDRGRFQTFFMRRGARVWGRKGYEVL